MTTLTEEQAHDWLRANIEKCGHIGDGGMTRWAKENGFTLPYVSLIMSGNKRLSTRLAAAIGLRKVRTIVYTYEEI